MRGTGCVWHNRGGCALVQLYYVEYEGRGEWGDPMVGIRHRGIAYAGSQLVPLHTKLSCVMASTKDKCCLQELNDGYMASQILVYC